MELSYPPFETIDTQGKPYGVSVALAEAMGKYLNREIVIENIPFIGLIPSLKVGKIDLILSSMSITPEREKSIAFSDPYLATGLCLLINKKTKADTIEALDDPRYTLVVKLGTTGEVYAKAHLKKVNIRSLDRESTCVLEVVQGRASAFIYDQFSVLRNWQKYAQATYANLHPFSHEYWAIGLRKEDTALQGQINDFLKAFRADKGFEKLADTYLREQKALFQEQGIPFVFDLPNQ
ncbi:MAG: transporter substrate-binding domain-containing protein [Chlamydiota bacterium]